MENAEEISIEVAFALPEKQLILALSVPAGTTIGQAIRLSGILDKVPEIDLPHHKVGIFGKLGKLEDTLHAGDRVEIYRPLIADPKEVRKQRAAQGKSMKKGSS